MARALIFFAPGLEECEGLIVVDVLRRSHVDVDIAAVGGDLDVTSSHGVRIRGLKYEVSDFTVSNAIAQLSNELAGLDASISVEHGTLIVTYPAAIAPPAVTNGVAAADTLGALSTHVSDRLRASF